MCCVYCDATRERKILVAALSPMLCCAIEQCNAQAQSQSAPCSQLTHSLLSLLSVLIAFFHREGARKEDQTPRQVKHSRRSECERLRIVAQEWCITSARTRNNGSDSHSKTESLSNDHYSNTQTRIQQRARVSHQLFSSRDASTLDTTRLHVFARSPTTL